MRSLIMFSMSIVGAHAMSSPATPPPPDEVVKSVDIKGQVPDFSKMLRFKAGHTQMLRGTDLSPPVAGHGNSLPESALASGAVPNQGVLPAAPPVGGAPSTTENSLISFSEHSAELKVEEGSHGGGCKTVRIPQCFGGVHYSASIRVARVSRAEEINIGMEKMFAMLPAAFSLLGDNSATAAEMARIQAVLCSAIVPPCASDCTPQLCCADECETLQNEVFNDEHRSQLKMLGPNGSLREMLNSMIEGPALRILDRAVEVLSNAHCRGSDVFSNSSSQCLKREDFKQDHVCNVEHRSDGANSIPQIKPLGHFSSTEEIEEEAADLLLQNITKEEKGLGATGTNESADSMNERSSNKTLNVLAAAEGHPLPTWRLETPVSAHLEHLTLSTNHTDESPISLTDGQVETSPNHTAGRGEGSMPDTVDSSEEVLGEERERNLTKAEAAALKEETRRMKAEEATLANQFKLPGNRTNEDESFIEPAFTKSESEIIESTLSDVGTSEMRKAFDRTVRTGGQYHWVGEAKGGSSALSQFAKIQPRYTHEEAIKMIMEKSSSGK